MRRVPRRSAAVLLAGLVAVGIAGVTRVATAEQVPSAAKATDLVAKPPLLRPAKPTGAQPVQLEIQLKSGAHTGTSARRLSVASSASTVDTIVEAGPDRVVVTVRADEASTALAKLRKDSSVTSAKIQTRYYPSAVDPNDPWAWRQGVGQPASSTVEGHNLAKTSVQTAWATTTGSSDVTIAVVDTGVTAVPDLAGSLLPGANFVTRVGGKINGLPTTNVTDDAGHGTMVASLLGANTDNGLGIAGVCWTCRILPVKVLGPNGGSALDVADGIRWAVDHGADIINMSLGGDADDELADAIAYAVAHKVVLIAAAGNSGWYDKREYPAGYTGVISVGATDEHDQPYPFSNYGDWVTMAAPGLAWMDATDGEPDAAFGTSMSAPLVAGVAGLVLAAHPGATVAQIKDAVSSDSTTDYIGGSFGGGRLNAAKAVAKLPFIGKTAPSVRVTGPVNRFQRGATSITVATGADIVSVRATEGSTEIGADTSAPWAINWTPDLRNDGPAEGDHPVALTITNAAGEQTQAIVPLVADLTAPAITGATPAQLAKVKGVVTVGASGVSDKNGVSYAALYADGVLVGKDTASPYSVKYTSTKRNGTVRLEWRIFDKAGNSTVFKRSIVADNTAPKVKITSGPKNKAKVKGTVKLKVTASDYYGVNRVELLINGKVVAKDTTSAYTFSVKVSKYSKKMKVQVRAIDTVGNVKYDTTRNWTR
jgi:subtilisin family serine protease